ncbi:hypothetical protein KTR10_01515 [Candidatus Kaiserbacteria bacterium]|nr:hypothetical protein [Candidatus Kaiserbacteria bacterium]
MSNRHIQKNTRGFTILIAVVVASIVLSIGLAVLGIVFKQLQISGIAHESETAFHAAYAGAECAEFNDRSEDQNEFDVPGNGSLQSSATNITCMGVSSTNSNGRARSGDEQRFEFTWDGGNACTILSFYKFYSTSSSVSVIVEGTQLRSDCPVGAECSVVKARGYNASCSGLTGDRVVEREITIVF